MIILDTGSGNTCQNDLGKVKEIIDSLEGKDVILKWQLFLNEPPNVPLKHDVFRFAYEYATEKGLVTTSSVFDYESLEFLQEFDIPFIKLANKQRLYKLARGITTPLVISYPSSEQMQENSRIKPLCCVSRYPAQIAQYENNFTSYWLSQGISDHTEGLDFYYKYQPEIYECHYCLKHSKTNPDGGVFAKTPKELEAIL